MIKTKEIVIVATVLVLLAVSSVVGIVKYVKYEMRKPDVVVAQSAPQNTATVQHPERTH